jgi:hypothetical protein
MIRKEVMIVLVTFCLTATLFSIIPVGSQGVREYDPWYDINDDGKIDLKDYYGVGLKYATTGDPTKNVNVTNLVPYKLNYEILYLGRRNVTGGSFVWIANYSGGYSRIGFFAIAYEGAGASAGLLYSFNLSLVDWYWKLQQYDFDVVYERPSWSNRGTLYEGAIMSEGASPLTLVNQAPYFKVLLYLNTDYPQPGNVWVIFDFYAYMRNE